MNIVWQILIAVFAFGMIIFVHELGHFTVAKLSKMRVNEFAIGMGPVLFSKQLGETRYALRLLPIGGFVAVEGEDEGSNDPRAFGNVKLWKRACFICAGAFMNLVLGLVLFGFYTGTLDQIPTTTVAGFKENAQSNAALQAGDRILKVNGGRVFSTDDIQLAMLLDKDGFVDFTVLRDGQELELNAVDFGMQTLEDGKRIIKFDFYVQWEEKGFVNGLQFVFLKTFSAVRQVVLSLVYLVTGNFKLSDLSGPVGVATTIGQAAKIGIDRLLEFVALISVNIGIFNLLPLPALDGGRLLFLIIEGIRKKPVNPKYEAIIHGAGLVLLMGLMVFVTFQDFIRL